jgi:hypothetical protein
MIPLGLLLVAAAQTFNPFRNEPIPQTIMPGQTATVTPVSPGVNVTTTSVVIAPANPNRRGFVIFNNSSNSAYVSLAATSVASTCTRLVAAFASWEMVGGLAYTGPISAIRNSGAGIVTVWEFL